MLAIVRKNIRWSDKEIEIYRRRKYREIGRSIMKRFCVDKTAVEAFYIILHNKDAKQSGNKNTNDYALEYKLKHVHVISG